MNAQEFGIIVAALNQKATAFTVRPKERPLEMTGFVACRDELTFTPTGLSESAKMFDLGLAAFRSRFAFAKQDFENERGPALLVAEEYAVAPEMTEKENQPTGRIGLYAQFVFKPAVALFTPEPPAPDSNHG